MFTKMFKNVYKNMCHNYIVFYPNVIQKFQNKILSMIMTQDMYRSGCSTVHRKTRNHKIRHRQTNID